MGALAQSQTGKAKLSRLKRRAEKWPWGLSEADLAVKMLLAQQECPLFRLKAVQQAVRAISGDAELHFATG